MKRIITTTVLLSSLLLSTQSIYAGDHKHDKDFDDGDKVTYMIKRMTKKLDLTEQQQNNIRPVLQEKMDKMKAIHTESKEKIKGFLTDEQIQKLEEKSKSCKRKGKKHKRGHNHDH